MKLKNSTTQLENSRESLASIVATTDEIPGIQDKVGRLDNIS